MRVFALFLAVHLLASSQIAFAQSDTEVAAGSHIRQARRAEIPEDLSYEEQGRYTVAEFAKCTITNNPRGVAAYIGGSLLGDSAELSKLVSNDCIIDGWLNMPPELFRGALYGQLYKRYKNPHRKADWAFPIIGFDLNAPVTADTSIAMRANLASMAFADCVHKSAPADVEAVVLNLAGTKAQKNAFQAVIPRLGACLPAGQSASLNRSGLESIFGEYLYRSLAPASAATSGSKP